ncbi:MAG: glutathione S-transferase [Sneathiellales bacterium]|nr:glutathione S-transferase [Sneathiellales bacterium]
MSISPLNLKMPVLYSFRRCPYAMRARMAIHSSSLAVELRDILLKDKPVSMLDASPKGTVPVLVLEDGTVIDESIDILFWALKASDPDHLLAKTVPLRSEMEDLIAENDGPFKSALDKYKYHVRFPEHSREDYRAQGEEFLQKLENRLVTNKFLFGDQPTAADFAIFPFIRQFANSDRDWFDRAPYPKLQQWLEYWISSAAFKHIMKKRPLWSSGKTGPIFPKLERSETT